MNILVTCGPTCESIDPVRFISNYSTGLLGSEIAREAKKRGHRVVLIRGKTNLSTPHGVKVIDAFTADRMQKELNTRFSWCDCLIMSAAICDFRVKRAAKRKIKRGSRKEITLKLKQNPDILAGLSRRKGKKMLVGFALETENLKENAQDKLRQKNLDLILATLMKKDTYPFGLVRLDALILDKKGRLQKVRQITKKRLARILLDRIEKTQLY